VLVCKHKKRIEQRTTLIAALQGTLSTGHMVANLAVNVLNKEK
jgi:hypothetical protein